MKRCLCCHTEVHDHAATCHACGEASFVEIPAETTDQLSSEQLKLATEESKRKVRR